MADSIQKIVENLGTQTTLESTCALFSDPRYAAIPFSIAHFHSFPKQSHGRLIFIDGGNLEIFHSPDNSVALVRIYYAAFQNNKRVTLPQKQKIEFYVHAYTQKWNDELVYRADLYPQQESDMRYLPKDDDLIFSINEETLSTGGFQVEIAKIGETARRFAEWSLAAKLAENLEPGDIIVHDGTLQSSVKNENKYIEQLYAVAKDKGIIVCGFAKTTTLLTDTGHSLPAFIAELAKEANLETWYYHPVAIITSNDHKAELVIAKLHDRSKHAFRIEVFNQQKKSIPEVMVLLAENAKDVTFPGYPYGLIDADKNAGISLKEKQYYSLRLSTLLSEKAAKRLKRSMTATNAHDIIDKVV